MTWTPEITTVNQRVQIGPESTSALGTAVAAGKLMECFDWQFAINADIKFYTPTGHKAPTTQEQHTEWVDGTLGGDLDYNGVIYPLGSICGSVAPASHGSSAVAKDWIFNPPTTGSIVPQTFTVQQGDATRARQFTYCIFSEFGYKMTRKDVTCSGKFLAQPISDGITLTSSPTAIALAPTTGKQVNVFLDTSSGGLGTTQLLRVLSLDYLFTNVYGPLWVLNRSTVGWTAHVDLMPKATMKIKVEADANGMAFLSYMESGATYWMRVAMQGTVIDNNQTVSLGSPSAGNFTLTYKGQTTSNIAYNATSATVQTAFQGLSTVGTNATVAGSAGGPYTISFTGTLATDTTAVTGNGAGLTGGTFLITQTQIYNTLNHDMAIKFNKPTGVFADDQGVFALEWEADIVEDPTWGKSQLFTCTNLITAL